MVKLNVMAMVMGSVMYDFKYRCWSRHGDGRDYGQVQTQAQAQAQGYCRTHVHGHAYVHGYTDGHAPGHVHVVTIKLILMARIRLSDILLSHEHLHLQLGGRTHGPLERIHNLGCNIAYTLRLGLMPLIRGEGELYGGC